MSTLVVYYSPSCGNTERIAEMVADELDADIEAIETVDPYPGDYQGAVDQGKREVEHGMSVQFDSTGGDRMITLLADVERWVDSLK
ncbi:hypothetical protein [Enorma phocaeensis]|uniref:Glutaredoxin n=1 Tax=Enorma phocaeensis TaxID=1871019 RepID=A0A921IUE9_9ACTN|nr:hypothetical protein [Enorma phocaeensis]HJG37733.1 hypothetical protein [Enorma phocaeensis]